MTGLYVAEKAVAEARYWADSHFREGPNNENPFSFWQYGNYYAPYCDSFVCYASYKGGFRFFGGDYGEKGYAWVPAHHRAALERGIARGKDTPVRPGWLAIFGWDQPDQHIEMVISRDDPSKPLSSFIATVGGNTGNAVLYRIRYRRDVEVFIAMDEAGQNASAPTIPEVSVKGTEKTDFKVTKDDGGRYFLGADGGVFCYGTAKYHGSVPELVAQGKGKPLDLLTDWAVGILLTPTEQGYWILTRLGSVFAFGDAKFNGTFHAVCNNTNPMVGIMTSGASYAGMRWDGRRMAGQAG